MNIGDMIVQSPRVSRTMNGDTNIIEDTNIRVSHGLLKLATCIRCSRSGVLDDNPRDGDRADVFRTLVPASNNPKDPSNSVSLSRTLPMECPSFEHGQT